MLEIIKFNNKYLLVTRNEIEVNSVVNYSFEVIKEFNSETEVLDFLYCASEFYKELNKKTEHSITDYEKPKYEAKIVQARG